MNTTLNLRTILVCVIACVAIFSTYGQSDQPCAPAPMLPVNATCVNTAGTTAGAVYQNNGWNFGGTTCGSSGPDVWYRFTAPASGSVTINTTAGTITDGCMAVYSAAVPCSNTGYALLSCDDDSGPGLMPLITQGALSPGAVYYIRFWRYGGGTGTFSICVVANPPPPPCVADMVITTTNYSQNGLTTCGFGDNFDNTDACGSSYMNGDDIVISYTPTSSGCMNFQLSGTSTYVGMFLTNGCPGDVGVSCLASATAAGGNPSINNFNVTAGVTYFLTVSTWPAPQCTPFNLNIAPCPPPPPNDECNTAMAVPVNPDQNCGTTVAGWLTNATSSFQGNSCGAASDHDDVWFTFVATGTTHTIDLLNITGTTTDLYHAVWGVACGSIGTTTALLCSDPNSSVLSGLTPGMTYYVRVYTWSSTPGQTVNFNICIGTPPPPPPNDDPCGAIPLPVNSSCSYTLTSNYSATATAGAPAPGCAAYSGGDVWFTVTVPPSGTVVLNSNTGTMLDGGMAVYSGTCGSLTLISCDDDSSPNGAMPMLTVGGQTPGATLYVRFWDYGGGSGLFSICAYEGMPMGPCGNPLNEDFCDAPAFLTQGPGSWSSSTYNYYTPDMPANSGSLFCGSTENNSWYEFTAQNTTETFNFSVSNCLNNSGIQAQVYNVTTNASGCCTNFASVSNCGNPGTMVGGTVTATGLTIGNNYILMVDGFAGDNCNFTVTNWTAVGIQLPVDLLSFTGISMPMENVLNWVTATEQSCERFDVLRTFDNINYEKIGEVKGAGTSLSQQSYAFRDTEIRTGTAYYKLQQFDFNGSSNYSEVVVLDRSSNKEGLLATYPNPASNTLYVEVNGSVGDRIELTDGRGTLLQIIELESNQYQQLNLNISSLNKGIYLLRYVNSTGSSNTHKIIKQ